MQIGTRSAVEWWAAPRTDTFQAGWIDDYKNSLHRTHRTATVMDLPRTAAAEPVVMASPLNEKTATSPKRSQSPR